MDKIVLFGQSILAMLAGNRIAILVALAVCIDTVFGCFRAIREHKLNSCFGIDGALRKIAMLVSVVLLAVVDLVIHINLLPFLPEEALAFFGLQRVGTAEFFGVLYICYEAVSILKNMYLCGLPVYFVWKHVRDFLEKYTDELPDDDEIVAPKHGNEVNSK
jgi:toxin secretion/phage lysis holin